MYLTINRKDSDVKIAYEVIGNEGAEPLLFLHGLGAGRAQTTAAMTDLEKHRVIAPDMLGHGDSISENADDVQSFDQFADDSIAILDEALRYPERVNKLILLRPSWMDQKQPEHLSLVAYVGQWIEELGVEKAQENLHANTEYQELLERVPKVALSIDGLFGRPGHFSHTAVLHRMWKDAPFASLDLLKTISNQVLVMYTDRDDLHPIPVSGSDQCGRLND